MIGLVIPDITKSVLPEVARGVQDQAASRLPRRRGQRDWAPRTRSQIPGLCRRQPHGCLDRQPQRSGRGPCSRPGDPSCCSARAADELLCDACHVGQYGGVRLATRHLLEHWYRRIGFIRGARWCRARQPAMRRLDDWGSRSMTLHRRGAVHLAGRQIGARNCDCSLIHPTALLVANTCSRSARCLPRAEFGIAIPTICRSLASTTRRCRGNCRPDHRGQAQIRHRRTPSRC